MQWRDGGKARRLLASWGCLTTMSQEGTPALSTRILSNGAVPCRPAAPLTPGPAGRLGAVSCWHHPGQERLPTRGVGRVERRWLLARHTPTLTRVVLRRCRQGGSLPHPGRDTPLLRVPVALAAPGGPGGDDGPGAGRLRLVESALVETQSAVGLASPAARASQQPVPADRAAAAGGRARPGARAGTRLDRRGRRLNGSAAGRRLGGGPARPLGGADRPATRAPGQRLVRAVDLGGIGLPRAQKPRLAVATHAPPRTRAGQCVRAGLDLAPPPGGAWPSLAPPLVGPAPLALAGAGAAPHACGTIMTHSGSIPPLFNPPCSYG